MLILSTLAIATALAMDSFAVSISAGITVTQNKVHTALKVAILFGLFQGLMPIIGWAAGYSSREYIAAFDHWIAFILLATIGAKMIYEGMKNGDENKADISGLLVLTILAIATSIDAFAAGLSFAFFNLPIIIPAIIIGAVTFAFSLAGFFLGGRWGSRIGSKAEIMGGLILIGIGAKILIEDMGLP